MPAKRTPSAPNPRAARRDAAAAAAATAPTSPAPTSPAPTDADTPQALNGAIGWIQSYPGPDGSARYIDIREVVAIEPGVGRTVVTLRGGGTIALACKADDLAQDVADAQMELHQQAHALAMAAGGTQA